MMGRQVWFMRIIMSNEIRSYRVYLDVLEMLLTVDVKTAGSYFHEFSYLVSTMDYLDYYTPYTRYTINLGNSTEN